MRKALFILALTVLSFVSCSKEEPNDLQEVKEVPSTIINFNLTANHPDGTTKAVKTGWETGDVIFVFFNNIAAPRYLRMCYDGSTWGYTQMNGTTEESLGLVENATGTMRAIFLPFASDADITANGTVFKFSKTTYSYYLTATLDYTVTGGEVSGTFNMQIPSGYIQFFLDDSSASSSTQIELREPNLTPQGIASIAANGTINHTGTAYGASLPGYVYDKSAKESGESKGYLFSGILAPEVRNTSTNYYFALGVGGRQGTYYSKSFNNKTWYRNESSGRALKMPALSQWHSLSESYLVYKANPTTDDSGDDYYHDESYISGFSAKYVEMMFQLASSSDALCTIACENLEKDWYQRLYLSTTKLLWDQGDPTDYRNSISFTDAGISRTSSIVLRFDGSSHKLSVNDHVFDVDYDVFDFTHLFAAYYYERDEGAWRSIEGVPDGSRIYYILGWNESGNLVYIGYPVKKYLSSSAREEYCWYSYYSKRTSPNYTEFRAANDHANQGGFGGYIP